MKTKMKLVSITLSMLFFSMVANAQLSAGDIAFIGYNTDGVDDFTFIALTDIPAGEVIYFTEEGWDITANNWAGTSEGHATYTAPAGGLSCGTVVRIFESAGNVLSVDGSGSIALSTGSWSLSAGDQVLAYQASVPEPTTVPTFIAGVHGDDGQGTPPSLDATTGWNNTAALPLGNARSNVPPGLTNGLNCVSLFPAIGTEQDNAKYTGTLTGTSVALRTAINDRTNWSINDGTAFAIAPGDYSPSVTCAAPCTDPDAPTLSFTPTTVCVGGTASLTITGNLNDATSWEIYTGSCGGTNIGSNTSGTFAIPGTINASTTYFVRGEGGCVTPGTCESVTINPQTITNGTMTALADLCIDAGVQTGLGGGTPAGGVYSGPGVVDNGNGTTYSFNPAAAGVGTHTITYTPAGSCVTAGTDQVEVFALPTVNFTALADLCVNAGVQAGLGGGTPTGGVYSGPGVTDNGNGMTYSFDPLAAGVGTHTITYNFTNANGCSSSASDQVEVFALPMVSFTALPDLCVNDGVQTGLGGGTPNGGVYSGPGVTDNGNGMTYSFDPLAAGVGTHTITYNFTNANGCTASASDQVEVFAASIGAFTALADICVDAGVQVGLSGGTPTGGVYSGAGVTDDGNGMTYSFDPASAGVGTTTITYTPGGGCSTPAFDQVEVFALPTVNFTALADLCVNAGVQTGLGSGSPTTGSYSGPGVTDDGNGTTYSFDPASAGVGTHTITYTYTNANGCTGSAADQVEVFALPTVSFTALADICVDAGVQAGLGGGTPAGGSYSGAGVTDDGNGTTYSFDPSAAGVGTNTITYNFTDANGCAASANDQVEVFALPAVTFTGPGAFCTTDGVQTSLGGGAPTGGTYSGSGITDDGNGTTYSFDPSVTGAGTFVITYTYTDANGCTASATDNVTVTAGGVVTAVCQDITINLDANGEATIAAADIDGGSSVGCGTLNLAASQTLFTCADVPTGATPTNDMVITGVYDGPLSGGTPKGVELYVINNIADLSQYGIGSANNGGGSDGEEFTFPAVAATAGQFIYVAFEAPEFTNFFGFAPDYTDPAMSINGDDAFELFFQGGVIDVFGDINVDGTGEVWEHLDGWAYRVNDTGNDGSTWTPSNWTFSGINVFDGETSNATAATPFPLGTYSITVATPTQVTLTVTDGLGGSATCTANVTVVDNIAPTAACEDATVYLDATGNASITAGDVTGTTIVSYTVDQSGTFAPITSPISGTQVSLGDDDVSGALPIGFSFDFYDNTYTDFYISSNGFMTFSSGSGSGCCTGQNLPDASVPNNLIAFAWEDLDPGNGGAPTINNIQYTTIGTAPNRVLVMEFYNVDHFPNSNNVTTQVHLHETSNMIEIHTVDMPSDGGGHTMGIENFDGTQAMVVPGRNSASWSATNDYVAFMPVTTGNDDNCGVVSETLDISSFTCADLGTPVSVTMTVADAAGNTANCTAQVTVLDTISPTVTCPLDIIQDQDAAVCSADVAIPTIATADNCSGETIAWTITSSLGTSNGSGQPGTQTFPVGVSTVDLVATDASGNTSSCSFTVTVNDTVAPAVPVLSDLTDPCSVTAMVPTTTDNCNGTITGTTSDPLTYTAQGTFVITWSFDDGTNISTATQNVIITDATAPTASNIDTVNAECIGDVAIDVTLVDDEADNCTAAPTVTYVGDVASNGTGCNDTITRTYNVADDAGNNIDVTQIIILNDVTPPTASNPVTLSVQCLADVPTPTPSWVTDEADNCGAPIVTWLNDVSTNGTGCSDTITRTFEVSDACGNAITVEQTIIINDDTAPVLDVATLEDVVGFCDLTPATPTATDNCTGTINGVADVTFPVNTVGTTVVTWTFTDDCGNSTTQTQNVIVEQINVNTFFASDGITIVSLNNDAGVTFQWIDCNNGNQPMAGETNQNFTPTFSSDFAVIVTQDGCSDTSACVTITEVGLDELSSAGFELYPNPTMGQFTVSFEGKINTVELVDVTGRIVLTESNLNEGLIDASRLAPGKYMVRLTTEGGDAMTKPIVIGQ